MRIINSKSGIGVLAVLGMGLLTLNGSEAQTADPEHALGMLKAGNIRITAEEGERAEVLAEGRRKTAHGQQPFAVVVACSDSRSAPELVFDSTIGELFVVRSAGNLVDGYALGSIEYAVHHLGVRLVVVMGHERCGAVSAAVESASAPGHVRELVQDIQPAVKAAHMMEGDIIANSVAENARQVAEKIRRLAAFGELAGEVRVVAAVYDLDTGDVEWLNEIHTSEQVHE